MELWTSEEKINYIYAFMKYDNKDLVLDFWQDDYIRNRSRFISMIKSRQTGFSFIVAAKGLVKAMDPARTKYVKQFVSYNEEDAKEKIRYAKEFFDSIPKRYKKKLLHATTNMLEFEDLGGKTTSRLISLPCRPPRGKNGDVCLDEFAICHPRISNLIYTAASFGTLRKGCIEVGSTPLGTIGKFYDICTNKENYPNFDRYNVPWWYTQVMCKDIKTAVIEAKNMSTEERVFTFGTNRLIMLYKNSTLEDFQQECECTFIDSASSYISLELIYLNTPGKREEDIPSTFDDEEYFEAKRNIEIKTYQDEEELILNYDPEIHGSPLFMGMDVGRYSDSSAFYIIGKLEDKKRSVFRLEVKNVSFDKQKEIFRKLMNNLPIFRACIDKTGLGLGLAEDLNREFGDRVEPFLFTAQSKEVLAMSVKMGLERQEFELENDREFHNQIHSIKRTASIGGSFRYDSDRNEKGHSDSFWAWCLANYAASQSNKVNFYSEYASKKGVNMLESNNKFTQPSLTRQRGESLDVVLRRIQRGERSNNN